jgi:hypothetical protein
MRARSASAASASGAPRARIVQMEEEDDGEGFNGDDGGDGGVPWDVHADGAAGGEGGGSEGPLLESGFAAREFADALAAERAAAAGRPAGLPPLGGARRGAALPPLPAPAEPPRAPLPFSPGA